jgi:hypothetical protein
VVEVACTSDTETLDCLFDYYDTTVRLLTTCVTLLSKRRSLSRKGNSSDQGSGALSRAEGRSTILPACQMRDESECRFVRILLAYRESGQVAKAVVKCHGPCVHEAVHHGARTVRNELFTSSTNCVSKMRLFGVSSRGRER